MYTSSTETFAEQAIALMRYARRSARIAAAGSLLGNFREYVNIGEPIGVVVGLGLGLGLCVPVCVFTATRSLKSRIVFILLPYITFRESVNC